MTEPKWTPGPWVIDIDPRPGMEWNRDIVSAANPAIRIAFMTSDGPCANAHLIAASPELYAALAIIRKWMIAGMDWTDAAGQEMKRSADAALAKANPMSHEE